MSEKISATFGTRKILTMIQQQHADRDLLLMQANATEDRYMLLDLSGEKTVFSSPVSYDVLLAKGNEDWHGMTSFIFMDLPIEEQKVFNSKFTAFRAEFEKPNGLKHFWILREAKNDAAFVIVTNWHSDSEYAVWLRSESFKPFAKYLTPDFDYHESRYAFVRSLKS